MAAWAAWVSGLSTNPKPLERPVSRSVMIWIFSTAPYDSKSWRERRFRGTIREVPYKDIHTASSTLCIMETIARSSEPYAGKNRIGNSQLMIEVVCCYKARYIERPYYTEGDARRAAHWHYLGSSLALGASGNRHSNGGNRVDVYVGAGRIMGWVDYALSTDEQDDWGGH